MKTTEISYQAQADKFAKKNGIKLTVLSNEYKAHFGLNTLRYVFKLKLTRAGKSYTFEFGQSINEGSNEPNMYDVLTCLTKNDPCTFEDFCGEFGYDEDSRTAERTYKAEVKEWRAVKRLFGDILEELQEVN